MIFFAFFGKTTGYGKVFKILFRKFSLRHRYTLCSNFVKFGRRKLVKSCVIYLTKKQNSSASQVVATARFAPKICQDQPPTMYSECSRFHPNRFTFCGVIVERVNTAKSPRKVNPILGRSSRRTYSFESNKYVCCVAVSGTRNLLPNKTCEDEVIVVIQCKCTFILCYYETMIYSYA